MDSRNCIVIFYKASIVAKQILKIAFYSLVLIYNVYFQILK